MIKKRLLFISLWAFTSLTLLAQQYTYTERNPYSGQSYKIDSMVRYWEDGALTFDDFSVRKNELPKISEFDYGFSWNWGRKKISNTVIRAPFSRTYMNPFKSWIHPEFRTPEMLEYFQTAFDYVEICRRRAQREYMEGSNYDIASVMDFHFDVADGFIEQLKENTQQGLDTAAVHQYSAMVKKEMAITPESSDVNLDVSDGGFGIGCHAGVGSEYYTGPIASYINPIVGLQFGCDLMFNRFVFFMGGLLGGGGRYKKDIPLDGYSWSAGEHMSGGNMELSLGYALLDNNWWRLTPFAGIGVGFIDYPYNPSDPDDDNDEISGFRYQAGLSAELKFRRIVDLISLSNSLSEYSVRARLYVAHNAFPTPVPTWTINFGVYVNALAWMFPLR